MHDPSFRLAIVILNYNSWWDAIRCLHSLEIQSWRAQVRVYVVENGSPNSSLRWLRDERVARRYRPTIVASPQNLGFARGNNLGIAAARGDGADLVLCVNSDIVFPKDPKFLDRLEETVHRDPTVAVVAPQVVNPMGLNQNPYRASPLTPVEVALRRLFYLTPVSQVYLRLRLGVGFRPISAYFDWQQARRARRARKPLAEPAAGAIYAPHGSAFALTPAFFGSYDGLDGGTFLYCEEFVLGERVRQAGLKVHFDPRLHLLHNECSSTRSSHTDRRALVAFVVPHNFASWRYYLRDVLR